LFGEIVDSQMCLSKIGCVVAEEWLQSSVIRPEIELDEWVVMPNHMHGIIVFTESAGVHGHAPLPGGVAYRKPRSLSSLIAGFKSTATKRINAIRNTPSAPVWQHNYHERIIRNEEALHNIRRYIIDNPQRWTEDAENLWNCFAN
jgi:REP element-mobilizing transposase RayT